MYETIFIIGGGPSLVGYNWELLRGRRIIGINRAFEVVPWADFIYFTDTKFFEEYRDKGLLQVDAILATSNDKISHPKVVNFRDTGVNGLDLDMNCLRVGKNSGHAAINLAIHLKAKNIVLMGFDMCVDMIDVTRLSDKRVTKVTGRTHWHSGYRVGPNLRTYTTMLKHFPTLVEPLNELGVKVFNANLNSKLNVFQKVSLEEAHLIGLKDAGNTPLN